MVTTIDLISATDQITFLPAPSPENGWVYDNEALDRWYELPDIELKLSKRPNAHGAYDPGQLFAREHRPILPGQYFGTTAADALAQRERLNAFYSDGNPITMRVNDESGSTTRVVRVLEVSPLFKHDFSHFPFDMSLVAVDPRRYGAQVSDSTGMPSAGSGLVWDLGTAPSGLFWDWGTVGVSGQVTITNSGKTSTLPRVEVGGPGAFDAGFRITEVETGRALIYSRATSYNDLLVLDSRTMRATLGEGDVTTFLTSRQWFEIPAGETRRYQINPLGSTSGNPTMTVYAFPASM